MANAARLEVDFPFGGRTYAIKPSFEVIGGIEAATGMACIALAKKCWATDPDEYPSLTLMGQMVYALLRPFDKDITVERVGQVLLEDGCVDLYQPLGEFLSRTLRGHKDHMRQVEEEARKSEAAARQAGGGENHPPSPPTGDAQSNGG